MPSSPAWHPAIGLLNGASAPAATASSPAYLPHIGLLYGASAAGLVAPTVTTTSLVDGDVGTPYSVTLAATGTTPMTWAVVSGALPSWASLAGSTGVLSGTPDAPSLATFTVRATNGTGSDDQALTLATANEASGGGEIDESSDVSIAVPAVTLSWSAYAPTIVVSGSDIWTAQDGSAGIWTQAVSSDGEWTAQ